MPTDTIEESVREACDSYQKQPDLQGWNEFRSVYEIDVRARRKASVLQKVANIRNRFRFLKGVSFMAHLSKHWPDGSAAAYVRDDRVGWLEFDVSSKALPQGTQTGDRFEVLLKLDGDNNVLSYQIPARVKVVPRSEESFGEKLTKDIPKPPANWDDATAVARYREQLENWRKTSGLK